MEITRGKLLFYWQKLCRIENGGHGDTAFMYSNTHAMGGEYCTTVRSGEATTWVGGFGGDCDIATGLPPGAVYDDNKLTGLRFKQWQSLHQHTRHTRSASAYNKGTVGGGEQRSSAIFD